MKPSWIWWIRRGLPLPTHIPTAQRSAKNEVIDIGLINTYCTAQISEPWILPSIGCGTFWSLDSNWKLTYQICMYKAPKCIEPFNWKLHYVSSCPKESIPKMAFCREHCEVAEKQNIPTELHRYLQHCKNNQTAQPFAPSSAETAADCQGNTLSDFI